MSAATRHFLIGLSIRLIVAFLLPIALDDGLLLRGVRYTDIDYDVFTDAAEHVAQGRSPYERHTYRYTPFLAALLAVSSRYRGKSLAIVSLPLSKKYFGKILFCIADAICGYIIVMLRWRKRSILGEQQTFTERKATFTNLSPDFVDALWWLYNPLPINICTRGSAESLVVLLPVLATVAVAEMIPSKQQKSQWSGNVIARACIAGILHGIGIHAKLYPLIYTVSFMAFFSHQQQSMSTMRENSNNLQAGWSHLLSQQMQFFGTCFCCGPSKSSGSHTFPWRHPLRIFALAILWVQRLFLTISSVLFLAFTIVTAGALTYAAVHFYGPEALDQGLLFHFQRIDHRHNYSMYFYWIYLSRGQASTALSGSSIAWGHLPTIPQILILGFASLGIAPYDLTLALFLQTFAFVAFNKVLTAQYFTWYLCLLPLSTDRIVWRSKEMLFSLTFLFVAIILWLLSAFTLEMLGWRSHRQVWMASVLFFASNLKLLHAILNGYEVKSMSIPGQGWSKSKIS